MSVLINGMKMPTTGIEWRKWNAMNTKPITNYDRIISKTSEELAEKFADGCCRDSQCEDKYRMPDGLNCYGCWLNWLKAEVEE